MLSIPIYLGITPKVVVRFMSFEKFKEMMPYENEAKKITHPLGLLAAGVLAGNT